jgi:PAS domain S-box-containing protein
MNFFETLKNLNRLNKRSEFREYRERNLRSVTSLLAISGSVLLAVWHIFDYYYYPSNAFRLLLVRLVFIASYVLIWILSQKSIARFQKNILIAGFYCGALFSTMIAHYSGGYDSNYWIVLNILLIAWIIVAPVKYSGHILHSFVFVLQYLLILYFLNPYGFEWKHCVDILLMLTGTLILGMIVGFNRNRMDAVNFVSREKMALSLERVKNYNLILTTEAQKRTEAEKYLGESRQLLTSIIDNVPIIIWSIDMDGRFISSEGSGLDRLGSKSGFSVGKLITELYPADSEVVKFTKRALKGEIVSDIVQYGGIYYDTRITPLYDKDGKQYGISGMALDITERMKMQKELEVSELKHRSLVENAIDGIAITQKGILKYANKAFYEMTGYTKEEMDSVFGPDYIVPEDRGKFNEIMRRRLAGENINYIQNTSLIRKDKALVNVEMSAVDLIYEGVPSTYVTIRDMSERNKILKELRESEEKYRKLIEQAHDGIIITQNGKFRFVNPALCGMLEYSVDEVIDKPFLDVVAPEYHQKLRELHQRRMQGDTFDLIYNAEAITKSGKRVKLELNTAMIEYEGNPASFVILRDITEREKMQHDLKESRELYQMIVEGVEDGIFDWNITSGDVFFSKRYKEILGFQDHEFRNHVDEWAMRLHPEDKDRVLKMNQDYIDGLSDRYESEYRLMHKDGNYRWILARGYCMRDEKGKGHRMVGTHIDMTERNQMQEDLKISEQKYRELADFLPQTLYELDLEGRLNYTNKAGMDVFGITKKDLGRNATDFLVPGDRQRLSENIRRAITGTLEKEVNEYTALHSSGKKFPVMIYGTSMFSNNKLVGARGVIVDISDRKHAEDQVRIAKEELEELNRDLEKRVKESTEKLTNANTQLIKLQKENLQSQFEMLKQQVNPHFLFNSLNVLSSLIKIDADTAEKFTGQLAVVYRYVLENKEKELVPVQTELDFLSAYIFLLDIRFTDKLKVNIDLPEDKREYLILPLAMQLLIENAIKHNAFSKKSPLVIDIFVDEKNYLNIVNNLQERDSHFASTGVGLKNIESRYSLLTDLKPAFIKKDKSFIAKIPLLE